MMSRGRLQKGMAVVWVGVLVVWGVVALFVVPALIGSAYGGRSLSFINGLIAGQGQTPLSEYQALWTRVAVRVTVVLVVLGVTVAFAALIKLLGMILGSGLFLAVLVRYLGRHSWLLVLSVAAGAAGFNWLVFAHWLHVPFPVGPLGF